MLVERFGAAHRAAWDELVQSSKNGTFLFRRDYMEYHADRFEDGSLVARQAADKPPLALLAASRHGATLDSHGGLTYGGWVCDGRMTASLMLELFDELRRFLQSWGVTLLRYRPVPHVYHRAPAEEDLYALAQHGAQLVRRAPLSVIDLGRPLTAQVRRARGAQKARAHGVECRESDELSEYWTLLATVLRETYDASPVHTLEEISELRNRFPGNIRLFGSYAGDRLVAGVLVFETETVARAQYIASSAEGKRVAALDLLFEHLLRRVYADKRWFDLGTSAGPGVGGLNSGVIEFKESLGARLVVQDVYELEVSAANG
jgi:GNAT acetyltransferase-like protein